MRDASGGANKEEKYLLVKGGQYAQLILRLKNRNYRTTPRKNSESKGLFDASKD